MGRRLRRGGSERVLTAIPLDPRDHLIEHRLERGGGPEAEDPAYLERRFSGNGHAARGTRQSRGGFEPTEARGQRTDVVELTVASPESDTVLYRGDRDPRIVGR